jgi:hypothetical protein
MRRRLSRLRASRFGVQGRVCASRFGARGLFALVLAGMMIGQSGMAGAQARRTQPRRAPAPTAKPAQTVTQPAVVTCPQLLGDGVKTSRTFCDVQIGRDPEGGVIVAIPPHRGTVLLSFDLHNRHTYSEDEIRAKRGYRRYTAMIGVLAMDNTLLGRATVQNEFRTAADLFDRVSGGVGPGGVKAVAPTGSEQVMMEIEEQAERVSLLGDRLSVVTVDGTDTFSASGRPIAVVSNVMVTYTPGPPASTRKPAPRR